MDAGHAAIWVALIGAASSATAILLGRRIERAKVKTDAANANVSETQVVVNAWKDLLAAKERELEHKDQLLANEQAIAASFAAANERLQEENRELRDERDRCPSHHPREEPPG